MKEASHTKMTSGLRLLPGIGLVDLAAPCGQDLVKAYRIAVGKPSEDEGIVNP